MKKWISLIIIFLMCASMSACVTDKNDNMDAYAGNTYVGTSPWGEEVSVAVKNYDAEEETIDLIYTENIDSEHTLKIDWSGLMVGKNSVAIGCAGSREEDGYGVEYKYDLNMEFKNQTITLTYLDGQKTELSSEGGSGFHQVGALSEEEKTILLERK
ncbi:MAG: hypothetical protein KBS63_04710 [Clostridiales bacterium]|nr:hypothetical protein [Candidatus Crickella caballi]